MASGRKNYFRHSLTAFEDEKIQKLISLLGYEGYAYYFILLEMCAKQCENEFKPEIKFHLRSLALVWSKRVDSVHLVLTKMQLSGLLVVTKMENTVSIAIPNLSKYLGKYGTKNDPNSPNKEKKRKEKESKYKTKSGKPDNSVELFSIESNLDLEEIPISQKASNVITILNALTFKNFRPVPGNLKFIEARLREGFSLEDFQAVIKFKHSQWELTDMAKFIRPETLFGNKFDSYLQEAKAGIPENSILEAAEKMYKDAFGVVGE